MPQDQDPDRELIQGAQEGDQWAFDQLVLKYRNRVMGVATRMLGNRVDAEDLAQDVFVKVYHSVKSFKGEALFSTWLYRITANSCLNHRRKTKMGPESGDIGIGEDSTSSDIASNPQTLLEEKEVRLVVEEAIQALPQEQKVVLILRDIEGLSYEAIADSLGIELGTVRSRLHRARLGVRARVKKVSSLDF